VLADVIASGIVPVIRLTEVFRQPAASRSITTVHRINHAQMPGLWGRCKEKQMTPEL